MDTWSNFLVGLTIALQPNNLLYCFIGVFLGTLIGVLPGIGPTTAVSILLPATYKLNPISAIIMLSGISYGAQYGGSTTSILVNVPGEGSSVITCVDGYQMAKKGRAGPALGIAAFGSFIAGTVSVMGLMFLAPTLARAALKFGPAEYFSIMLTSLVMVTYLVRGSMVKGLITVGLGLFLGIIGLDPLSTKERFTYGLPALRDGIGIIPAAVGLFGVAEILETIGSAFKGDIFEKKIKGYLPNRQDWKDSGGPIVRGTLLGFLLGILPGVTTSIPAFISYGLEKRLSKFPERFGTGVIEGVAGPEASNNAASVGGFVPLLSLGIPSTGFNAVLLGALLIYGLQPGPLLIKNNPNLFWAVIASMYLGNGMLVVLNLPLIPIWIQVLRIPYTLLSVIILIYCFLGTYSIHNNIYDVIFTFAFGVLGYIIKKYRFEKPPLILAFILGPFIEVAFRQSMLFSDGSPTIFINRPISASFILVALGIIISAFIKKRTFVTKIEEEK